MIRNELLQNLLVNKESGLHYVAFLCHLPFVLCSFLHPPLPAPPFTTRFFFGQVSSTPITATPSSILPPSTVSRKSLTSLFGDMAQIPLLIGEGEAFGSLAAAVESCFHAATNGLDGVDSITVEAFLEWMKQVG